MHVRWRSATLIGVLIMVGLTGGAQALRASQLAEAARAVWTDDAADVPALAREVDHMLESGRLALARVQRDGRFAGRTHERLDQYHDGVRVFGGQLVWQKESGLVVSVTGRLYEGIDVSSEPGISEHDAASRALARGEPEARVVGQTELMVLPLRDRFALAYRMYLRGRGTVEVFFVDAQSGEVLLRFNGLREQTSTVGLAIGTWSDQKKMVAEAAAGTHRAVDRLRPFGIKTYDVNFDFNAWNNYAAARDSFLATDLDNEWRDGAVVDAHTYAGYTYDYYYKRHGRNGIDDKGESAINFVHIIPRRFGFNNAFYDPVDNSMNYYDGDGETFNFFSSGLDVVAHELTHGVTEFSSDLIYLNESGALNEAISDIMGASIEWYFEPPGNGRQQADWILGEDLFLSFGPAFRSFSDPMAFGDPDHYSVRCDTECPEDVDNGGVHINSSIANHAFYLMVVGGTNKTSGVTVEGVGMAQMDRIESIFYRAFMFFLVPSSNFSAARQATIRAAQELYGAGGVEEQTVRSGWNAVGVQ